VVNSSNIRPQVTYIASPIASAGYRSAKLANFIFQQPSKTGSTRNNQSVFNASPDENGLVEIVTLLELSSSNEKKEGPPPPGQIVSPSNSRDLPRSKTSRKQLLMDPSVTVSASSTPSLQQHLLDRKLRTNDSLTSATVSTTSKSHLFAKENGEKVIEGHRQKRLRKKSESRKARLLKRSETLIPSVVFVGKETAEVETPSVISRISIDSDFDEEGEEQDCNTESLSFPPPHTDGWGKENAYVCCIQTLDEDKERDDKQFSFRVSFEGREGHVDLKGDEILGFCSALIEYDDSWTFKVTMMSSGVRTSLEPQYTVETLEFLLYAMVLPTAKSCSKTRMPWQRDWLFIDDEEGESAAQM